MHADPFVRIRFEYSKTGWVVAHHSLPTNCTVAVLVLVTRTR